MSIFQWFAFVVITDRLALTPAFCYFLFFSLHLMPLLLFPCIPELSEFILGCHLILFIVVLVYLLSSSAVVSLDVSISSEQSTRASKSLPGVRGGLLTTTEVLFSSSLLSTVLAIRSCCHVCFNHQLRFVKLYLCVSIFLTFPLLYVLPVLPDFFICHFLPVWRTRFTSLHG